MQTHCYDAAIRTRISCGRRDEPRKAAETVIRFRSLSCWVTVIFSLLSCVRKSAPDPQAVYKDAWSKLKRGDLGGARAEIDTIQFRDSASDQEWSSKFRVLKGEVLVRQGMDDEALNLLAASLPEQLASSDTAVWRKMAEGMASCHLGRYDEAAKYLEAAENLAKRNQRELLGEVALRKGTLAFLRGDLTAARSEYLIALNIARNLNDLYLEAGCLSNLWTRCDQRRAV